MRTAKLFTLLGLVPAAMLPAAEEVLVPHPVDPGISIRLFAEHPQIVTPTGLAVDREGAVFVIESHTHFRPKDYEGPERDLVLRLRDTDGDGRADERVVFHEGTTATMDLAFNSEGWLYVAERDRIQRLRDLDGDGSAEASEVVVRLETKGDYPHNGLSGLAFDFAGNLVFGFGENLGFDYTLHGVDGVALSGGGEGGHVYRCAADGTGLTEIATGFWNPFGGCVDAFGRIFAVDNDPGGSPPCRLLHIVEGGDYGYKYRYGRSGIHPFVSWTGTLPGTLPMVAGTGEAPCEILSYDSDGLPERYRGDLLVTSWADHRIERYRLQAEGGSFTSVREDFIVGGEHFRPVGMDVGPDGSLWIGDWFDRSYQLHGKGRIWRVMASEARPAKRPGHPAEAVLSPDRETREEAARKLVLKQQWNPLRRALRQGGDARIRATSLQALAQGGAPNLNLARLIERDSSPEIQALAHRLILETGEPFSAFTASVPGAVDRQEVAALRGKGVTDYLLELSDDSDPFLRHAAIHALSESPVALRQVKPETLAGDAQKIALLLAMKKSGDKAFRKRIRGFLNDSSPRVRFEAVRWIADADLAGFRDDVAAQLDRDDLNFELFHGCLLALDWLDERKRQDRPNDKALLARLFDEHSPALVRAMCLRLLRPDHPQLTTAKLKQFLEENDAGIRLEALRTMSEAPSDERVALLLEVLRDPATSVALKLEALPGLALEAERHRGLLLSLTRANVPALQREALKLLRGVELDEAEREQIETLGEEQPHVRAGVRLVLGRSLPVPLPPPEDVAQWMNRLAAVPGEPDPAAGRRVFFHLKTGACFQCHQVDGRGRRVGPDMTGAYQMDAARLLESILEPSREVAPQYYPWEIETEDGEQYVGFSLRKGGGDAEIYLNAQGKEFGVKKSKMRYKREQKTSIMPAGLVDAITDRELRDLLAFLKQRR